MKEQLNRVLNIKYVPKRIVSLVPSQTELLCDLGLEKNLVGITKFCVHPKCIKTKALIVRGTKKIDIEKITALKPDIILCNKEENTKKIVEDCNRICTVHVSDIYTLNDCYQLIRHYGVLFNKNSKALDIIDKIKAEAFDFKNFMKDRPFFKTTYFIWRNPWMVAANQTFIDYMMQLNKF